MRAVSVVIPTWNGLDLLQQFFPSVTVAVRRYHEQSGAPVEIIVVDDGGSDATPEWLRNQGFSPAVSCGANAEGVDLRFIRNERNIGFGGTCNRGFAAARWPLVFLINNDIEVDINAIVPLAEHFDDPLVFAVHCQARPFDDRARLGNGQLGSFARGFISVHRGYAAETNDGGPLYSMFASGGSAMFDRNKLRAAGGFEPLLAPFYWEDVEICYRMWKRGYVVLYEPRSVIYHQFSSTTRKLEGRRVKRIQNRNRLIYHWINLHDRPLFASHIAWVVLLAVTAPFTKPRFLLSLWDAVRKLPDIRRRRREEIKAAKRSDSDIFEFFKSFEGLR